MDTNNEVEDSQIEDDKQKVDTESITNPNQNQSIAPDKSESSSTNQDQPIITNKDDVPPTNNDAPIIINKGEESKYQDYIDEDENKNSNSVILKPPTS